ncbi:ATP-binding cassette domain-containing protein [Methylomarinum sp. Ch1-1]|uniref:ATP-binding cassette domain-containing protein n=1 Tax=Methylomarinum roseum TaxID=3067653 RepID=A0AAU7NZD5_9GAMM|nr:ATP-binding cassette domain-containing protein [Methylomarinum sp. Ch1-1]MDP4521631.1 ATP-binding cassette domain-containing protein [Methylomarinum sp. Ch1-1]
MTAIHIDIASKVYPPKHRKQPAHQAIAKFGLSVADNEFVCLVGPSGCGKTTLLNIIAGLDDQYQGKIVLGQQQHSPRIGYVFQNPRLLPWHSVRENIELAAPQPLATDLLDSLLETMQLTAVQNAYPEHLSLGMSRRVAIIRAFAIDPDILLMDEPFVSLDAPTARQVRDLLLRLWIQRPHTVLFVTHDLREAIALADRLVFLSAPPMRVISGIKVPIARNQRNDEQAIESFRQQLLNNHPAIKQLL